MKKLVIVGDSAFAEIAFEYFKHDSDYEPVGFAVEKEFLSKTQLFGLPIVALENLEENFPSSNYELFIAITYNDMNMLRERIFAEVKSRGYKLASYISNRAFVWHNVKVGENCFIFEDNTIQPYVKINNNVIMWSGNHIGHHSVICDNNFISSHVVISGNCTINKNCFIGVNATIANNISIANSNLIGAGAIITKDTNEYDVYVPSKSILIDKKSFELKL